MRGESQQQLVQLGQAIGQGCLVLTGFCFLLISIPFFLSVRDALRRAAPFGPQEWSILIVIVPFAAFAVGLIVWGFRPLIARRKLGPVGVQITPAIVHPGESVTCAISFRPHGDIDLVEAATLKDLEVVERRGSKRDRHYRNVIFEQRTAIAEGRRLMGGESVTITGNMQVPLNVTPTFMAAHNSGMWLINVHLKLHGWPDWSHDFTLVVRR